jgi:peptide/nickel transport system permease protein
MRPDTEMTAQTEVATRQRRLEGWRHFLMVLFQRKVVIFGAVVILLLIITAIFAPLIAPYDPYEQNLHETLQQPSWRHILGTDQLGRDTLSRIIYSTRISLLVGIVSVVIAAGVGILLGLIAGFFGRWLNVVIMRFIDALMSIPPLILALAIATALGGGINNVIIGIGVALVPVYCRTMCGLVLSIKQTDYTMAGRLIGASNLRIMFRVILPNSLPPFLVLITLQLGLAILAEAGLSFLGLGITPPGAAWGSMIASGYGYLLNRPILSLAPGVCIIITVLAFNLLGDGIRDALDPRLRGTI